MPSTRRIKVFGLLVFISVIAVLFYTDSLRQERPRDLRTAGDFYSKTVNALQKDLKKGAAEDDTEVKARLQRLQDAAKQAKEMANSKSPKPDSPSAIEGVGSAADGTRERGVAGRKKMTAGEAQAPLKEETKEEHEVEVELNSILKKSPSEFPCAEVGAKDGFWTGLLIRGRLAVIIFSKSYCPHSKQAKDILLEKYMFDPAPFVVELDKHELGAQLQAKLAELTKRKTVPNVLVNGISIGGGDDMVELDEKGTLIEQIKKFGQKKILEAQKRTEEKKEGEKKKSVKKEKSGSQAPIHGLR
ncbi:hypothetical protein HYFRA_00002808 [Hymenoscyphus fraxineus]|uniref:Glutaredoxin domain-containing protein n=1 Tax=Hymenoscyphus fraxineus TaxID=746836 RepID=A0A9N9PFM4_9HELO|nr:hypothetical protein HYFRA_00002808 [Hymenoscyphus fraxineus]